MFIERLYGLLRLADYQEFGENTEMVKFAVQTQLSAISGHAKYIAQQIENYMSKPQSARYRADLMSTLASAGSPEALEEAGRFLFDDRNPDAELVKAHPELLEGDYPISLTPNSSSAAEAICWILGDKSPIPPRPRGVLLTTEQKNQLQKWWSSPEGMQVRANFKAPVFKQATFVKTEPDQNPSKTISKKATMPKTVAKSPPSSFSFLLIPVVILAALSAGAAAFFFRRKRP